MIRKEVLNVGGEEVVLDPANLKFNENTLTEYIKTEAGWYDNFGGYLARAEKLLQYCESEYDNLYNLRFYEFKDQGGSDKLAEARAKTDSDVQEARKLAIEAKHLVSRLKNHLRAWDRSHDNAQSMGHMLRKQMEQLNLDIRSAYNDWTPGSKDAGLYSHFGGIDDICKPVDTDDLDTKEE